TNLAAIHENIHVPACENNSARVNRWQGSFTKRLASLPISIDHYISMPDIPKRAPCEVSAPACRAVQTAEFSIARIENCRVTFRGRRQPIGRIHNPPNRFEHTIAECYIYVAASPANRLCQEYSLRRQIKEKTFIQE
ncbi:hypothetical protein, partial [Pseudomonas aeruginosa]|uniref:hypothetical protein n=1 Tax=Pseudomonas aeruginosa TaxID=287 RepID=UPI001ABCF52A